MTSPHSTELPEAEIAALADDTEYSAPEITIAAALDAFLDRPEPRKPTDGLRTKAEAARGTSIEAAAILGIKPRKLQAMAARGEIPGAAKLGRQWTFDFAKLRHFVQQQEKEWQGSARPRPGATGAGIPSGAALGSVGGSSVGRLRQMIRQSQKRVGKQAKREQ